VDDKPIEEWELVNIERSMAMAPSVPENIVRRLIAEIRRLRTMLSGLFQ